MERTFYVPVPEEEYFDRIGDALFLRLQKNGFSLAPLKENAKWMTHAEASAYLRKSPAALYKLTCERKIKYSKRGKQNYYLPENLDKYLLEGTLPTVDEIRSGAHLKPKYLSK